VSVDVNDIESAGVDEVYPYCLGLKGSSGIRFKVYVSQLTFAQRINGGFPVFTGLGNFLCIFFKFHVL
jgi:hypothetical protein